MFIQFLIKFYSYKIKHWSLKIQDRFYGEINATTFNHNEISVLSSHV